MGIMTSRKEYMEGVEQAQWHRLSQFLRRHGLRGEWHPHIEWMAVTDPETGELVYAGSTCNPEVEIPRLMEVLRSGR